MVSLTCCILIVWALILPASVQSQTPPAAAPDTALITTLREARLHNQFVRLTTPALIAGRIGDIEADEVRLVGGARIAMKDIEQIETRKRKGGGQRTGAFIGGAIGAIIVPAFAYVLSGIDDRPDHFGVAAAIFAGSFGAAIFGTIGALLGSPFGHPHDRWTVIWKRADNPPVPANPDASRGVVQLSHSELFIQ